MWQIDLTGSFKRQYKRLSPELQRKVDDAIFGLYASSDPHLKGRHKTAKFNCLCGYDLARKYRIPYEVDFETKTIYLQIRGMLNNIEPDLVPLNV